ncbi:MAG: hypothetical protein H6658_01990 [Ardenticatenaceae bacterium]|nr:hypothetical protein [Ardenticatenaceae bacterium]
MARPELDYEPVTINIKLRLHPEHDADLLAWFNNLPERGRATAVITRLRTGKAPMAESAIGMSDDDVTNALASLLL